MDSITDHRRRVPRRRATSITTLAALAASCCLGFSPPHPLLLLLQLKSVEAFVVYTPSLPPPTSRCSRSTNRPRSPFSASPRCTVPAQPLPQQQQLLCSTTASCSAASDRRAVGLRRVRSGVVAAASSVNGAADVSEDLGSARVHGREVPQLLDRIPVTGRDQVRQNKGTSVYDYAGAWREDVWCVV